VSAIRNGLGLAEQESMPRSAVSEAHFDEPAGVWQITNAAGHRFTARSRVPALVRSAPASVPLRKRAGRLIAGLAQATGFAAWCLAALVLVALPRRTHGSREIAKLTVEKYQFEAFPSWSVAHADRICPDSLDEINVYMNNNDTRDPWVTPYRFACGRNASGSVKFYVDSAGEDGEFNTADDIGNDR
jgi:hypothetical protein